MVINYIYNEWTSVILYTLFLESNPVKNNIIHVLSSYLTIIGKLSTALLVHPWSFFYS